ncbi:MAG: glycosyltransferase family 9 protein [Bacteroidota bacterium]
MKLKNIIISRTDSIGDVILTLPLAGVLKKLYPKCNITFLGNGYTQPVIDACEHIDHFLDWNLIKGQDEKQKINSFKAVEADVIIHVFPDKAISSLGKKAKIPIRIGTNHRFHHLFSCNKLIGLGRKNSPLHEVQLNLKLLKPFGVNKLYTLEEIPEYYGLTSIKPLKEDFRELISTDRFNLILHPKTKGSAREWGVENFVELIKILPRDKFKIFITGTNEEGKQIKESLIDKYPYIVDLSGKLSLNELISFISFADGLVASSTGPLHIAAAMGKHALGIYPPIRPMHPGRWAPLGRNASYFVLDKKCDLCRKNMDCECIRDIEPEEVKGRLIQLAVGNRQ